MGIVQVPYVLLGVEQVAPTKELVLIKAATRINKVAAIP
jgi:hypothetical protein